MIPEGAIHTPSFCNRHWTVISDTFGVRRLVAVVRAFQYSSVKWSELNPISPSIFEMADAVRRGGDCYLCFWGEKFLEELKGFVEHPPEWAQTKPPVERGRVPSGPPPSL